MQIAPVVLFRGRYFEPFAVLCQPYTTEFIVSTEDCKKKPDMPISAVSCFEGQNHRYDLKVWSFF